MAYLMGCGHTTNATRNGEPICAICCGIKSGAEVVIAECRGTVGLEGRKAKCICCGKLQDSKWELFLFEYQPKCEYDRCYDGCRGWD